MNARYFIYEILNNPPEYIYLLMHLPFLMKYSNWLIANISLKTNEGKITFNPKCNPHHPAQETDHSLTSVRCGLLMLIYYLSDRISAKQFTIIWKYMFKLIFGVGLSSVCCVHLPSARSLIGVLIAVSKFIPVKTMIWQSGNACLCKQGGL